MSKEAIVDYYESEAPRLAKEYVHQDDSIKTRFISYLIDNDIVDDNTFADFCETSIEVEAFHKFVDEKFREEYEEIEAGRLQQWKDERGQ